MDRQRGVHGIGAESGALIGHTPDEQCLCAPDKPLPKLATLSQGSFNAALADGSTLWIDMSEGERTIRALITRNGNEVIEMKD